MSEGDSNLTSGHDYDGIQEYDNPLPGWWLATFCATIIFSFLYYIHYELDGGGLTQSQELAYDLAQIKKLQPAAPAGQEPDAEAALAAAASSPEALQLGATVFAGKCAVCHGSQLEGGIGPNLVDEYWLHGKGTPADIVQVVSKGVLDKGMPNWDAILKAEELRAVAVFVHSKQGSTPPNARPPQGEKVVRN